MEYMHGWVSPDGWTLIDIASGKSHCALLSSVRCRLIYDISDLSQQRTFTGQDTRICGLAFGELTVEQEDALCHQLEQERR